MSLIFYGVCIFGVVFIGLLLVVLYSLLVMAQRGDEYLGKLELETLKEQKIRRPLQAKGKTGKLRCAEHLRFVSGWRQLIRELHPTKSRIGPWLIAQTAISLNSPVSGFAPGKPG